VLTGGELAACVIADSVVRIIPGAIGDEASALTDCFQDNLLAPPVYTRPAEFNGWKVPEVLLSGNFAEIEKWQDEQAWSRTKALRPDLIEEKYPAGYFFFSLFCLLYSSTRLLPIFFAEPSISL
jgi:tRNA (guanine37-N1)-methyltransferase